jgi:2-desacetyl-2-hydroxyethyl bacteriochlorophyllide A dehydrogenase
VRTSVFDGPRAIRIADAPDPQPGPGEAVVRVRAAGICGGDLHEWRAGRQLYDVPYPRPAQGHELAGEVRRVGEGVDLEPGARVAVMPMVSCGACRFCRAGSYALCPRLEHLGVARPGGFAQEAVAPAANLHVLPDGVSFAEGALLDCVAVAVHAVHRAPVPAGAHVAVSGTGAVGLATAQVARAAGAGRVTVVGTRPGPLAAARALGADATVDLSAGERPPADAEVVYETAGGAGLLERAAAMAGPGGTLAIVGEHFDPDPLDVAGAMARELTIAFVWSYGYWAGQDEYARALDLVAAGRVRLEPAVTHRVALDDLAAGYALAADRARSGAIKVLVEP